jgi:nucleoside-diphosphate-sugar epimerase
VAAGHEVTGLARSDEKAALVSSMGARPVGADLFDVAAVTRAVAGHDAVCNLATHIPPSAKVVLPSAWHENSRLHAEGSRVLVDAALEAGARTYLQHSAAFMYADGGDAWLDEDAPHDRPPHGEPLIEAERNAQRFASASGGNGVALRFGLFYGPDAGTTRDQLRIARLRILPMAGRREAYYPSIHTHDLGPAVVAALGVHSGAFNVVDDEPLTRAEHAEIVARELGAKRLRIPPGIPLKRLDYIARSQRVSNWRFKEATSWGPRYRSAREGWPAVIAALRATRTR